MNKEYKILIISEIDSTYIPNFIKYLKLENPHAHISLWGINRNVNIDISNLKEYLDECYLFDLKEGHTFIAYLNYLETSLYLRKHFNKFIASKRYDIINIHYVSSKYFFLLDIIKKVSDNLVLTPWGSDVYRIGKREKQLLRLFYKKADYFSGVNNRFTKDVINLFNIPISKLIEFDLGSVTIDYIIEHKNNNDSCTAKNNLRINDKYVITCGYNASPAQRHIQIIEAINKIKNQLPSNLILMFPFTYGGDKKYKDDVKKLVKSCNIEALYFEEFLEMQDLYTLRQATDMFIHIQTTDANSTSVGEYLLCEKKVINGSWLRYDELEIDGIIPYFIVDDVGNLKEVIMDAYKSNKPLLTDKIIGALKEKSCKVNAQKANNSFVKLLSK